MDTIYSRKRINLFKTKENKRTPRNRFKRNIYFLAIILFFILIIFIKMAYPVFIATCRNRAKSIAVNTLNKEVNSVMIMYNYDDLVEIKRDESGKISYISAKIIPINELVAKITKNIQESIDSSPSTTVNLNLGTVTGFSSLSRFSPKIAIKVEQAGNIETKINSEFEAMGINQTIHRIYLDLKCRIGILTPIESISENVHLDVLLTETVIVGEVPATYYNFENLGFEEVLNLVD